MKLNRLLLGSVLTLSLFACGHRDDKNPGLLGSISKMKDYADNINDEAKKSEARSEERRKSGDTVAMQYKDLEAYLPQISGYAPEGGPKGSQTNTPGVGSWSTAEQDYKSGDKTVNVSIMDYNSAHEAFIGLTALYGLNMSSEDDDKKQGSVDLGMNDVKGYETIYKKEKRAELALVISDRFVVNLKSEGDNSEDFLRDVAKNMKLKELASK